jgi:BlaI family transcriptional regulator, penicillinase repressor
MAKMMRTGVLPTPAELRLLDVLWRLGEGTIDEIVQASDETPAPNYKTVQTFLRIMENKKLVTHRVHGRAFVFRPRVQREEVNRLSVHSLLDRHFGGSRSDLLLNLLEDERIDPAELKAMEEMIHRYRQSKQGTPKGRNR